MSGTFFSDQNVAFIVGVVGISKSSVRSEFEFQKLVTVDTFMSDAEELRRRKRS